MAETAKAEAKGSPAQATQSSFANVLVPVLSVIGTGIGALGFVIFFGGFILWTQFDSAGLPANEAVAQVPRNDLVVTGASFLVTAFLFGLGAVVLAVATWDLLIGAKRRRNAEEARTKRRRAAADLKLLSGQISRIEVEVEQLDKRAKSLEAASAIAPEGLEKEQLRAARCAAEAELDERRRWLWEATENQRPAAEFALERAGEGITDAEEFTKKERLLQAFIGIALMAIVEAYVISTYLSELAGSYVWLVLGVALVTLVAAVAVVSMTGHFAWFAVCLFVGVVSTVAFSAYADTHSHAKMSPFTAVRDHVAVTGFFVAETADAVYAAKPDTNPQGYSADGKFKLDHQRITLLRLPKAGLSHVTIGPLMEENEAYTRSIELAYALCRYIPPPEGKTAEEAYSHCTSEARLAEASPRQLLAGG
jgi:hypothetical protein